MEKSVKNERMDFSEYWPYFIILVIVIAQETDCILLLQGFIKRAFCNLLIVNEHYETHLIFLLLMIILLYCRLILPLLTHFLSQQR